MKFGISLSTYETNFGCINLKKGTLEAKIKMASELGYDGLDLFSHDMTDTEIGNLKMLLKKYKMEAAMFIPFFLAELHLSFTDNNGANRQDFIKKYKAQIKIAQNIGAKTMPLGFIRGELQSYDTLCAYKERLADSLREISRYAKEHGVTICFEPINSNEVNTFYHCKDVYDYLKEYKLDDMMLLLDTYHIYYEYTSQVEAIEYCKDRIGHYHLSDSDRLPAGEGLIDFKSALKKLSSINYSGYASMESKPSSTEYAAGKSAMDYVKKIKEGF